jgi:pimeloyl-ACP methyl ester carboxylesterase
MDERSILFRGVRIAYFIGGSGPAVVFVHGFPMDHAVWEAFVKPLTFNYTIILPDNPGFGKSALPEGEMEMDVYTDSIKAVLEAEQISSCVMIGHSMGGYITLRFAEAFPQKLKGMGLLHSTSREDDKAKKEDRQRVADFVRRNGAAPFVKELIRKLFSDGYTASHRNEIKRLIERYSLIQPEGIACASLAMGMRTDTTAVLRQVMAPVLFIWGKEDKTIPLQQALQLTHLPQRSLVHILEHVAHMGMLEAPAETENAVLEFLELCEVFTASSSE